MCGRSCRRRPAADRRTPSWERVCWVHAKAAGPCGPGCFAAPSVGAVGFTERGRVPENEGGVVATVPGFDGADGIALGGEAVVLDVRGQVGDDGAVVKLCHVVVSCAAS